MKLQRTLAALIFGLSAFAHAAPADDMLASARDNLYVGVNGSLFDDPTVLGVGGHVGAILHPNLAAEARLGLGLGDDNNVEIDNYVAFLAKGILPIDSNLAVYGVAGLARVAYSVDGWWGSDSGSESGITLGLGAQYHPSPEITLSAEFLMLPEVEALSIGISHKL
ncbi:MAG TPA: outer membrane beta-barrel protein [Pseudomonas sp.]|nr:outer membrane beta-barrel protein [Pseudomonas sp.]